MNDPCKKEITDALRAEIIAQAACRKSPCGWMSFHGKGPQWDEYEILCNAWQEAKRMLWEVTDVEYDKDGFRNVVWTWRFWKVQVRKCCWYQKTSPITGSWRAGWTMGKKQEAESDLVRVCGLEELYKSPGEYIEAQFPNLKRKTPDESK